MIECKERHKTNANKSKVFNVLWDLKVNFDSVGLLEMAPQVGIEPTTCGLTVRRSNRLSY